MELVSAPERTPALEAVFQPVQPPTTFEETVERLGTAIRLGLLQPGSRLPPERDLADRLRISRSTLRQSLGSARLSRRASDGAPNSFSTLPTDSASIPRTC